MTERERPTRPKRPIEPIPATEPHLATAGTTDEVAPPRRPVVPKRQRRGDGVRPAARPAEPAEPADEIVAAPAGPVAVASVPRRWNLTLETGLYLLFLVAAILSRFWNLGAKALHHDESLHAYYSWVYETGGGYRHDPLMHGPFLFHANALVYLLFGDSDASSRYMPALFGVVLVGLPYLLRSPRLLGRWGALATSFFFLVSPVLLYQSRFIRHDIYTVVGTLLLFIAIVRYWEVPQRRWIVIGLGTLAFLLANHEIIFAIGAIFAVYLYGAFLLELVRKWRIANRQAAAALIALHASTLVLLGGLWTLMPARYKDRIFAIPWDNPTKQQQIDYYQNLAKNPLVLGLLTVLVAFVVLLWLVLDSARDRNRAGDGWLAGVLGDPEARTMSAWVRNVFADRRGLTVGALVFAFIFVTLYTSLYTNLYGLFTATFATDGTLLYWLGQQDYQRGEQPWFYFLVLMPQYEYVGLTLGGAMAVYATARAVGSAFGLCRPGRNLFIRLFVAVWFGGIFAGLSMAGEKMPWLLAHITLPSILLAGALVGGLIERVAALRARTAADSRPLLPFGWPEWSLGAVILGGIASFVILASHWTLGRYVEYDGPQADRGGWIRALTSDALSRWWWLALPPLAVLAAIAVVTLLRGSTRAGLVTACSFAAVLALLQVNAGWRLAYGEPDVPKEMMIYTQTSPDVTRVVDEITQLSFELTGGFGMEVWYDSGVSWPMQWYLRDFPNKRFVGTSIASPPDNAPVLLVSTQYDGGFAPQLAGYTAQEYVLRWWFPEEEYRGFAIAPEIPVTRSAWTTESQPHGIGDIASSVVDTVDGNMTPDGQARLFRLILFRDLDRQLGQYDFKLYIRNDLLPLFNEIRY